LRRRGAALTASSAALVLGAGVIIVAFGSPGSHASLVSSDGPDNATKPLTPAASLHLVSVTPGAGAKGQKNPNGYTYALANQHYPETLTIWHNGRVVLKSLANTGIPASPTVDGTFPV
jgi:hypothetical protein